MIFMSHNYKDKAIVESISTQIATLFGHGNYGFNRNITLEMELFAMPFLLSYLEPPLLITL